MLHLAKRTWVVLVIQPVVIAAQTFCLVKSA
jgi:hypothetical protein